MQEFISMGGYAGYVWSAFGLTFAVFIWNIGAARAYHARAVMKARRRLAVEEDSRQ